MLLLALALAAPTALTDTHSRDIACVVEIAVAAQSDAAVQTSGRRWAGVVGDRIMFETGQPRELVAVAMSEAAKARQGRATDTATLAACTRQMNAELAIADTANAPLPKPVRAQ